MTSLDARLFASVAVFAMLLAATTTLYALGIDAGALYLGGILTGVSVVLIDQLRAKIDHSRRSGHHPPIAPEYARRIPDPPPLPDRDGIRTRPLRPDVPPPPPEAKRDATPMTERVLEYIATRRYSEGRALAIQYRRPDLVQRVDDAEAAEQRTARRHADDTGQHRPGARRRDPTR